MLRPSPGACIAPSVVLSQPSSYSCIYCCIYSYSFCRMSKDFLGADQRKVVEGKKKEDIVGTMTPMLPFIYSLNKLQMNVENNGF